MSYDTTASDHLNYNTVFSQSNIDFFQNCNLRATKYYNNELPRVESVDINACYVNIIRNEKYRFAQHNGTEKTTESKGGDIKDTSFYYVVFNKPSEETTAIFGSECWIMGFNLNRLKLKVTIKYEHIVFSSNRLGPREVFSMDVSGRNQRRVTRSGSNSNPVWGPIE